MDKILKVAKRLKTFTLEDIAMFCEIDAKTAEKILKESENIKPCGDKFEYVETIKKDDKFEIEYPITECVNLDITVVESCSEFLKIYKKVLSGTEYDEFVIQTPVADNWSQVSFYHHLNCLDLCAEDILLYEVDKRLEIMQTKIRRAIEIYNELELLGVPFAQHTNNTHLCQSSLFFR